MQSDFCPSACIVELPSKPHRGRSASVGGFSNALIVSLAAQLGNGFFAVEPDVFQFIFFHSVLWCPVGRDYAYARP